MQKYFILLLSSCYISFLPENISAQNIPLAEKKILQNKIYHSEFQPNNSSTYNTKGAGNLLLTFYQKYISRQISADCIFKPSCSRYSRECINKYGLLKGMLMTGDRLTRCNGFSARDIPFFKFKEDGYVYDLP